MGAYAARYAAKNAVAAGLAAECEVQLSYSIGLSRPVSLQIETFGSGVLPDEEIAALLKQHFDFRLAGILKQFNLRFLPSSMRGGSIENWRRTAMWGESTSACPGKWRTKRRCCGNAGGLRAMMA